MDRLARRKGRRRWRSIAGNQSVHRVARLDVLPAAEAVGNADQAHWGAGIDPDSTHARGEIDRDERQKVAFSVIEPGTIHGEAPALASILTLPKSVASDRGVSHIGPSRRESHSVNFARGEPAGTAFPGASTIFRQGGATGGETGQEAAALLAVRCEGQDGGRDRQRRPRASAVIAADQI